MLISSHQKRRFLDRDIPLLKFNDHISSVTSDRFLGVIIDRNLIIDEHVNYLYNKLLKLLGLLWRFRNNLDLKSKLLFYNSYVQPCIDYCRTVWGTCSKVHLDRLTRLQIRIGRLILNNYDSSKGYVFAQLGWLTVLLITTSYYLCLNVFIIWRHLTYSVFLKILQENIIIY